MFVNQGIARKLGTKLRDNLESLASNEDKKVTSFKDKFSIDAYHGTRQEVAINPIEGIYDGFPRKMLVEDEGSPIKQKSIFWLFSFR